MSKNNISRQLLVENFRRYAVSPEDRYIGLPTAYNKSTSGKHYFGCEEFEYVTEKEALYIVKVQNMTYKKVGERFGVTDKAIEALLRNARIRLNCKKKQELFDRVFGKKSELEDKEMLLKKFRKM